MADEVTYTIGLQVANGELLLDINDKTRYADQSAKVIARDTKSIPTTAAGTSLSFGSVSTPGLAHFVNTDSSNFVEIGVQVASTFYPVAKLLAGEAALIPLSSTTIYARADTAAVLLDFVVVAR